MSTDNGLIGLYTTQFSTNFELLLQQQSSMVRGRVKEGAHVGKMASPINQTGTVAMKKPAGRFAPLERQDASYQRPWVFPTEGEIPQLVDSFDELQTVADPKSSLVEAASAAAGRAWDDCIMLQACSTMQVGQDASALTAQTFDTTKFQVAENFDGSNNGLTVTKIIEAKRILRHYHNDLERDTPILMIGSQQETDLLKQVQVVSTEFNDKPVLVDGHVKRFLGFDIIVSERVPETTAGSVRGVIAAVKSGLYLGIWKDTTHNIDVRADLSGRPWQILTTAMFGATRTQAGKVVQILCADTTGSDITA